MPICAESIISSQKAPDSKDQLFFSVLKNYLTEQYMTHLYWRVLESVRWKFYLWFAIFVDKENILSISFLVFDGDLAVSVTNWSI